MKVGNKVALVLLLCLMKSNGFSKKNLKGVIERFHSFDFCATKTSDIIKSVVFTALTINLAVCGVQPSWAENSGWTDRNRLAAEAWRTVDEVFYERTFNGNDWFKLREEIVKKNYRTDEEVYESIKNMLAKLGDKYTRYLPPVQYQTILNSALGELTGVGLELQTADDGSVKAVNVQDDSPALEAGLVPGDTLLNVDGTETRGLGPEEVAALLRGKEGTKASLRVSRVDGTTKDFTAIRRPLRIRGVTWQCEKVKGKTLGIVSIRSFSSTTADDVADAIVAIQKSSPVDRLVLDLRNNGGGLLQGGVQTANTLLPPGKIVVFVVAKDDKVEVQQTLPGVLANPSPLVPDLTTPLDVLVNGNTASAAEVLAAALKENGRARLVGEKTFGKGVIQGGVAVTVAKYETPLHHNINKVGIPVDVKLICPATATVASCMNEML